MFKARRLAWDVHEEDYPAGGSLQEKLRFLLRYAVLAPSGHNSQPWRFRLGSDRLDLLADAARALPVIDPHNRELFLSCGAALMNLRIACRHYRLDVAVEIHPEPLVAARLGIGGRTPEASQDWEELFAGLLCRRTHRLEFAPGPVSEEAFLRLEHGVRAEGASLFSVPAGALRSRVAGLIAQADRQLASDPAYKQELENWLRRNQGTSSEEFAATLGPLFIRLFAAGAAVAPRDEHLAGTAPLLLVISTAEENPDAWIRGGQALQRMLLAAAAQGLQGSYLNQPIQIPDLREELKRALELEGYPQLLLRMGPEARRLAATPRRIVDEVLDES